MDYLSGLDPEARLLTELFVPHLYEKATQLNPNSRFAHYSSAETAIKIISNREVWMRNARYQNDHSEIEHGLDCLMYAYNKNRTFVSEVLGSFSNVLCASIETTFKDYYAYISNDTYISCLSLHESHEVYNGRLSMWRGYGNLEDAVALILKPEPFLRPTDALRAYTFPIRYGYEQDFEAQFLSMLTRWKEEKETLSQFAVDVLTYWVIVCFLNLIVSQKHPGFREETEWRVIYNPGLKKSLRISPETVSFRGGPEIIQKIPLTDVPDEGLAGIEPRELIERIIINPRMAMPDRAIAALSAILTKNGFSDVSDRITVSDIPWRSL
jgi:hypothetical protein